MTTVVWTEIPVSDLDAGMAFYSKVFGWQMKAEQMGPNLGANFTDDLTSISGHLYPGTPANGNGPTIHLAVDQLEAAAERCKAAGGTIIGEPVEIPPGRFQYATDPDGNSLGLFEPKAA